MVVNEVFRRPGGLSKNPTLMAGLGWVIGLSSTVGHMYLRRWIANNPNEDITMITSGVSNNYNNNNLQQLS